VSLLRLLIALVSDGLRDELPSEGAWACRTRTLPGRVSARCRLGPGAIKLLHWRSQVVAKGKNHALHQSHRHRGSTQGSILRLGTVPGEWAARKHGGLDLRLSGTGRRNR